MLVGLFGSRYCWARTIMLGKSVLMYALTRRRTMRARIIAVFVAGLLITASSFIAGPATAQNGPAAQAGTAKPIGKVITVVGSVSIEHVNAVVVQANVTSQPAQTKVGDAVYLGDVCLLYTSPSPRDRT